VNAVEIEEAISQLAEHPFDAATFPFAFLEAFGNKETTIKRLKTSAGNKSDIEGAVLQANNIHIFACAKGGVTNTLGKLKFSPTTTRQKAKFILATDGDEFQAEDLSSGETVVCTYADFPNHFGFFLPLAGISTVKQISDNAFDIRATSRLNKLYVTLLQDNPEWGADERRPEMNHFMARLIFCFFAEDTGIFSGTSLFTGTVEKMSAKDSSNTHEVISEIFRAMNVEKDKRDSANLPRWAKDFPYVNGGLFSDSTETPKFSKIARSYLLHVGNLDWTKINPDIFGSMIQAVADDTERGALGMHYTSVPNILKVLNPLFLDDLREQLETADTPIKLLNLRKRMARIRVFDPACGSGNFLVIAYKEMRAIEAEINKRRGEEYRSSDIPLTNFRGIELRDFPAEIARLALIIAEYQCNVLYRGAMAALDVFLPLKKENWIICGNALRLDWLTVCEPTGKGGGKIYGDDLFGAPLDQVKIDFENEGGETYICGNPPYIGSTWQSDDQKSDLKSIFHHRTNSWKSLDYVSGWFMKAADYGVHTNSAAAFVSTNSICQGQQVPILWPLIFKTGHDISFAHTNFKWANLASHNAGVTVIIVGISNHAEKVRKIFSIGDENVSLVKETGNINPYLAAGQTIFINKIAKPISKDLPDVVRGNIPVDAGFLYLNQDEKNEAIALTDPNIIRLCLGSDEFISGKQKYCLWLKDCGFTEISQNSFISSRLEKVSEARKNSTKAATRNAASTPHLFFERRQNGDEQIIAIPAISSENREYLPVGLLKSGTIITGKMYGIFNAPLWNMALVASRLHWVWIGTVCVRMRTDFSYSNTLGWNTFPVPDLTEKNKADLTRCAEDILLAREAHFPATIADLYNPEKMPENLRHAHERNDEVLERIYIGRRFKNDTERLEKLFDLYTKMTSEQKKPSVKRSKMK